MTTYRYVDPGGDRTLTEDQILDEYWEFWVAQMHKVNRSHLISRERCIEDWVTVHWAFEVKE